MRDGLLEVGRRDRDPVLGGERGGAILRARVHDVDAVAAALAVERQGVEVSDQPGAEHREPVGGQRDPSFGRGECEVPRSAAWSAAPIAPANGPSSARTIFTRSTGATAPRTDGDLVAERPEQQLAGLGDAAADDHALRA